MMLRPLAAILLLVHLTGCSVFMAATGSDDFDNSVIHVGAERTVIEQQLGRPISSLRMPAGDVATYQILTGDKADYRRAAAYALLDGLTLGVAEFVSFPTEALQGDQHIYRITYDRNGLAKHIDYTFKPAAAPNPSDLIEEQLTERGPQEA